MGAAETALSGGIDITSLTTIGELFDRVYPLVDEAIRAVPANDPRFRLVPRFETPLDPESTGTAHDLTVNVVNPYRTARDDSSFLGILSRRYWTASGLRILPAQVSTLGARFQKGGANDPWDGALSADTWAAIADKNRPEPEQWDYTSRRALGHHESEPAFLRADKLLSPKSVKHRRSVILKATGRILEGISALERIKQGEEPQIALAGLRAHFPKYDHKGLPFPIVGV